MIFTDYSNFQKQINTYNFEFAKTKEKINHKIKLKNGKIFKQVTIFEENEIGNDEQGKAHTKFGAWFVSDNDAIFLTLEELSKLSSKNDSISIIKERL